MKLLYYPNLMHTLFHFSKPLSIVRETRSQSNGRIFILPFDWDVDLELCRLEPRAECRAEFDMCVRTKDLMQGLSWIYVRSNVLLKSFCFVVNEPSVVTSPPPPAVNKSKTCDIFSYLQLKRGMHSHWNRLYVN